MTPQAPHDATWPGVVALRLDAARARFNLRLAPAGLAAASAAFGADIPPTIGARTVSGARTALCLGPDEWVLHADESERDAIAADFAALYAQVPHSLVDISDREIAILLEGPGALDLLATGCPLDLARIDVGWGARTVFDSAQIVLTRETPARFRIEVWRSFAPHVWGLLSIASAELAAEL